MCDFQHACFVSYRHHPQSRIAERFVEDLCKAIRNELALVMEEDLFIDRERMKGGHIFDEVLAEALCKSMCMIAIYTPTYFSRNNPYCAREYFGMEMLEQRRFSALANRRAGAGLIIPVVLRGAGSMPVEISKKRHYYSFERFALTSTDMSENEEFEDIVRQITAAILECRTALQSCPEEVITMCKDFRLPEIQQIDQWLTSIQPERQAFPLRSVS